jgi:hypothetical protein
MLADWYIDDQRLLCQACAAAEDRALVALRLPVALRPATAAEVLDLYRGYDCAECGRVSKPGDLVAKG